MAQSVGLSAETTWIRKVPLYYLPDGSSDFTILRSPGSLFASYVGHAPTSVLGHFQIKIETQVRKNPRDSGKMFLRTRSPMVSDRVGEAGSTEKIEP